MKNFKSMPISHRGLHGPTVPENSLGAFSESMKKNYAIELDIRLTKDNKLVVFHDANTLRLTGRSARVKDLILNELEKLQLLNSKQRIPSLKRTLEHIGGKVPLLIEIKNESKPGLLEDRLLELLDQYTGIFAIQSFNPLVLKYIKDQRPHFKVGLLTGSYKSSKLPFIKKFFLKHMLLVPFINLDFFSMEYGVDIWMQQAMIKLYSNKEVIYWTITNKEKGIDLISSGHGIIFEGFTI